MSKPRMTNAAGCKAVTLVRCALMEVAAYVVGERRRQCVPGSSVLDSDFS